jgi:hypothetical protein
MRTGHVAAIVVLVGCASGQKRSEPVESNAYRRAAPGPGDSPRAPAPVESPDSSPRSAEPRPTSAETRACAARGGTIQPVCMLGELMCVVPYRDGGKQCTDKSDCAGECLYEGPEPPPPNAVGKCQRTSDPCGCKALVHRGRVEPTLCAD